MESFLIRALQLILSLTILVFLHEGGHFLASKLFGVRVNKFYVFFDYKFKLFSTYSNWWRKLRGKAPVEKDEQGNPKYDGTEYGIGWIPLGGYCQIEGMIDETQHDVEKLKEPAKEYEFRGKPCWQRLIIMVAGVAVNFILALVIYSAVFMSWGEDVYALRDMQYGLKFNEDAKELGFKDGDIMLRSDVADFDTYNADMFRNLCAAHEVTVLRDGKETKVNLPGDLNMLNMLKVTPRFCEVFVPSVVDTVLAGTPAEKIGIQKGDTIVQLGDAPIDCWTTFTYEAGRMTDALADCKTPADSAKALTTTLIWKKAGVAANDSAMVATDTATVTFQYEEEAARLGIGMLHYSRLYEPQHLEYGVVDGTVRGVSYAIGMLSGYVSDMKYLASADGAKSVGGFGAIGSMFPPVWDWYMFWMMTAFLSIILAFMNILPIPALDGGHALFLLFEMITGKKPSDKFMVYAEYAGFGILCLLMVLANLNDVLRWIGVM